MLRAYRASVLVKPRPDLHRTPSGIIAAWTTVTASNGEPQAVPGYELTGEMGKLGFVEVVNSGPGGGFFPGKDMPDVAPGQVCVVDLGEVNKSVLSDGQVLWMVTGENLRAEVFTWHDYLGTEGLVEVIDPTRLPRPLMNNLLTERDPDSFVRHLYGKDFVGRMHLTEENLDKGVASDVMLTRSLRYVYERVLSHGPGRVISQGKGDHIKRVYVPVPDDVDGRLVVFSPTRSLRLTLGDRKLKLTPFQDVEGAFQDDRAA
jgi:hypothetical protein